MRKVLSVMLEDPWWMYYVKYHRYLEELDHPFRHRIVARLDARMELTEKTLMAYSAVAFHHRDPLKRLYRQAYEYAKTLEFMCLRNGITFIHSPEALSRSAKSEQLAILAANGVPVAPSWPFREVRDLRSLPADAYPVFTRNDAGHDSHNETMEGPFETFEDLARRYSGYNSRKRLDGHIAIKWVDTRSTSRTYQRYRIFASVDRVIPGNLYTSNHWFVHGANAIRTGAPWEEHIRFSKSELSVEDQRFFLRINRILGLKFSAIDYAYRADGTPIVWEANPHPSFPSWVDADHIKRRVTDLLSSLYEQELER